MSLHKFPSIGQRFNITRIEYEVAAIQDSLIRYSSVRGGRINHLPIDKYQHLLKEGTLTLIGKQPSEEVLPDNLSEVETSIMNRRLRYVIEIDSHAKHTTSKKEVKEIVKLVAKKIGDKSPPSRSSTSRWIKSYISSNKNPMSLVPKTKDRGNRYPRLDPNIERIINQRIQKDYLTQQRLSARAVHVNIINDIMEEYTKSDLEYISFPSERTINRRILRIDPYKRSKARKGKYVANKEFKGAGRGTVATRALETVEADGNILDVLIIDSETGEIVGRPYGTCLIDKYSRSIISFVITMIPFSSATLLRALKIAISGNNEKFGGLFETMVVDNGSDYISQSVRNFCNHTGIRIEHGAPRDPNSKPHVERFFGILNTQLVHQLPGTTFSNPADKGDYKSEKYACLTLEDLNKFVEQWLDTSYHRSIHRGHGRAPELLWKESIKDNPITTYPIEHLDTIAREVSERRISKGRVTVHNLQWYSHTLATVEQDCKNKGVPAKVDVYIDSLDLGKVFVKDPRDHTIFIQADAVFPNYAEGLSLYEHEIIRDKLKEKGKKDLASYGEYHLEIARWKLFEDIGNHSKEYSKKRIARIKETNKKNKLAKEFLEKKENKIIVKDEGSISITKEVDSNIPIDLSLGKLPPPRGDDSGDDLYSFERC